MLKDRTLKTNTTALYITQCVAPSGTHILIDPDGTVHAVDSSISLRGFPEDWLYFGRAHGDFDRTDWGIEWDERYEPGYYVHNDRQEAVAGPFDNDNEALEAAVEYFGLPAEIHDDLLDQVERLLI